MEKRLETTWGRNQGVSTKHHWRLFLHHGMLKLLQDQVRYSESTTWSYWSKTHFTKKGFVQLLGPNIRYEKGRMSSKCVSWLVWIESSFDIHLTQATYSQTTYLQKSVRSQILRSLLPVLSALCTRPHTAQHLSLPPAAVAWLPMVTHHLGFYLWSPLITR